MHSPLFGHAKRRNQEEQGKPGSAGGKPSGPAASAYYEGHRPEGYQDENWQDVHETSPPSLYADPLPDPALAVPTQTEVGTRPVVVGTGEGAEG